MNEEKQGFDWASLVLGILFLIGAYFAFANPIETFETFSLFFALLTILYGTFQIIRFFRLKKQARIYNFIWFDLLVGVFAVIIGIYFLINPQVGTSVLTALFAIWFLFIFIRGIFRAGLIREINLGLFWLSLIINILGIILGIILIFNPLNAFLTATTMLALGLLFGGIILIIDAFI